MELFRWTFRQRVAQGSCNGCYYSTVTCCEFTSNFNLIIVDIDENGEAWRRTCICTHLCHWLVTVSLKQTAAEQITLPTIVHWMFIEFYNSNAIALPRTLNGFVFRKYSFGQICHWFEKSCFCYFQWKIGANQRQDKYSAILKKFPPFILIPLGHTQC